MSRKVTILEGAIEIDGGKQDAPIGHNRETVNSEGRRLFGKKKKRGKTRFYDKWPQWWGCSALLATAINYLVLYLASAILVVEQVVWVLFISLIIICEWY